jgi:hypothetical protein
MSSSHRLLIICSSWENSGRDEPNWGIVSIYENVTTNPSVQLLQTNKKFLLKKV